MRGDDEKWGDPLSGDSCPLRVKSSLRLRSWTAIMLWRFFDDLSKLLLALCGRVDVGRLFLRCRNAGSGLIAVSDSWSASQPISMALSWPLPTEGRRTPSGRRIVFFESGLRRMTKSMMLLGGLDCMAVRRHSIAVAFDLLSRTSLFMATIWSLGRRRPSLYAAPPGMTVFTKIPMSMEPSLRLCADE